MNNLTIVNGLIDSRDFLNVINKLREEAGEKSLRSNVFNDRIADELEGEHYKTFVVRNSNNTETTVSQLDQDQALQVGMRESKSVRKKIRELLKSKQNQPPAIPQTYAEALQLAADQAKQLEEAKPKLEYHDKVLATENGITTTEIASELGMTANKLNKLLEAMKVQRKIGRRWVLTAANIGKGYDVETTHIDDGGVSRHAMKWSEKGRKFIHELIDQ